MTSGSQQSYLDHVVMEMVETERTYVCDLRMIVEDYLYYIIDQSPVSLSPDQVVSVFGNIDDIYEFNSELLQSLDLCVQDPVAVARCFVTKREDFRIYTKFCNNYPNSVSTLTDCMRNKSLAKFFRDRQASLQTPLPLGSYLLKPVQRILKYHLLLQEMAKNFNQNMEGLEVIEEAISTMTGVASYINDMKRKHEHAVRLQEVQSLLVNWKGSDLTTYGELVLEGTFKLHGAKNQRTLFLFQRLLLITRRRVDHFVYKTHISCSTLMLIDTKDCRSFSVTHYKRPKKPHTLQAQTVEERDLWARHIKRIILENHQALMPPQDRDIGMETSLWHPVRSRPGSDGSGHLVTAEGSQGRQPAFREVRAGMEATRPRPLPVGAEPEAPLRCLAPSPEVPLGPESPRDEDPHQSSEDLEEVILMTRDPRGLSSGESSDEDEAPRILQPSILNQAGDVTNHGSSARKPIWCQGDQPHSRGGALCPLVWEQVTPQGHGRRSAPDGTARPPDARRCSDSGGRQRRDSFLTHHDQMLIGKIRSYYESAVTRDSRLSLQRRDSLSHIPSGLVRTSVSRFNTPDLPAHPKPEAPAPDLPARPNPEAPASDFSAGPKSEEPAQDFPACTRPDAPAPDLPSHPKPESPTRIMESGPSLACPQSDAASWDSLEEEYRIAPQAIRTPCHTVELQTPSVTSVDPQHLRQASGRPLHVGEAAELLLRHKEPGSGRRVGEVMTPLQVRLAGRNDLRRAAIGNLQAPRAKQEPENDLAESKVMHLARCYSQRIREFKPVVQIRSPETQTGPRTLPSPSEESPVNNVEGQAATLSLDEDPVDTVAAALTQAHPPTGFHWPDVRELRSKYSNHLPSAAVDLRRPSSSTGLNRPDQDPQLDPNIHRRDVPEPQPCSAPSRELDPPLEEPCGKSREAPEASLAHDLQQKVGVSKKGQRCETSFENPEEEERTYVQIRSPTSREKISILAVVDRCRVYRDSEELRLREAATASERQEEKNFRPKTPTEQNLVKNLRERFQKSH